MFGGKIEQKLNHPPSSLLNSASWNTGEPCSFKAEVLFQVMMFKEPAKYIIYSHCIEKDSRQRAGMNAADQKILRGVWVEVKRSWRSG